jgi:uncharacterized protein YbjT (DUF2867 family)
MFGPGDALFGTLAALARRLPALPLIGGGSTRLQPIFVEDVAEAITRILSDPGTVGQTYELAGPGVYTLHEPRADALEILNSKRVFLAERPDPGAPHASLAKRFLGPLQA